MAALFCILGYVALAVCCLVLGRYLGWWPWYIGVRERIGYDDRRHPHYAKYSNGNYAQMTEEERASVVVERAYGSGSYEDDAMLIAAFSFLLWPATLAVASVRRAVQAADRARRNKLQLRSELESELAKARKEVESLLD